jgi:hypothetical protein
MKWVLCFLTPSDQVSFITDISDSTESVDYYKFLEFILPYVVSRRGDFLEHVNRYSTLFIDTENKEWNVYIKEHPKVGFEELLELNTRVEEQKKRENNKALFGDIGFYKTAIKRIFDRKHVNDRQNFNRQRPGEGFHSFLNRNRKNKSR